MKGTFVGLYGIGAVWNASHVAEDFARGDYVNAAANTAITLLCAREVYTLGIRETLFEQRTSAQRAVGVTLAGLVGVTNAASLHQYVEQDNTPGTYTAGLGIGIACLFAYLHLKKPKVQDTAQK